MLSKIKDFLGKSWALVTGIAVLVFIAIFRDFFGTVLVRLSNGLVKKNQNKSDELQKEQSKLQADSDKLIEESKSLESNKKPVDKDWYKS